MKSRPVHLRIAGVHSALLHTHLFPGDGKEAVAFALCGRHRARGHDILLVQEVHPIPYEDCLVRSPDLVKWRTEAIKPLLLRASQSTPKLGVVKFHSHPTGIESFSVTDDISDRDLFQSIYGWVDDNGPHGSVVLIENGQAFGRAVDVEGKFSSMERILVADHDIKLFASNLDNPLPSHAERHAQFLGEHTTSVLRELVVGVVGCSGTGSLVIEMLARLGVSELVLVDPDRIEYRNLNRIVGTTAADAAVGRLKVEALGKSVERMGLETRVVPVASEVASVRAVESLAGCDVVFGCMDSHDGRQTLNRLASFYVIPYFDCGVSLAADGRGGVEGISAASHYIQPGRSTLLGRKAIRQNRTEAEAMVRQDPERYRSLRRENYIEGVEVASPAVVSINALAASLVVNEFLARLHPSIRIGPNKQYAAVRINFAGMFLDLKPESGEQPLGRSLGRGDVDPLLDMVDLARSPGAE